MKIPYGPIHITHTVVDVGQRHSLVAWGGRWCSLVRQTWCSPHHELEQQSHSLVASGASLARLSPRPCIPLLQGPWWWILTCVSLHITSSLYHCKWLHHPPQWFWQISLHLGPGVRKPVSWVVYYVSASRQAPRETGEKNKNVIFFSERSRRLRCPDCSFAFLCWLLSLALTCFKASSPDHTRTDISTTALHLKYFYCQWFTGFFYCPHCSASKGKFAEELCR